MAEDPYSGEGYGPETMQGSIAGQAWNLFNPVSIAKYKYTMMPGTWSTSKGVSVPFSNLRKDYANIPGAAKNIFNTYKTKGFGAGTKTTFKNTKYLFGGGDSRVGKNLLSNARAISGTRDKLYDNLLKETGGSRWFTGVRNKNIKQGTMKARQLTDFFMDEIGGDFGEKLTEDFSRRQVGSLIKSGARQADYAPAFYSKMLKSGKVNTNDLKVLRRAINSGMKQSDDFLRAGLKGVNFGSTLTKAGAAKMAIGGMKALSIVGLATMAWDVAQAVGEPLGRAALNAGDRLLEGVSGRFDMETGGKLHMSYLSRGAATERQRAIEAISKSYINGRSGFGSESQYMHG